MAPEIIILPKSLDCIKRDRYTLCWLEGNILRIQIHENAYLDVDDMREIQLHKANLTRNQLHGVLFITPRLGSLSKEAREYAASPKASVNAIAKAVVTSNLGMRILTNFFIVVNKPALPHRSFLSQEEGIKWLAQMLEQAGISRI